MYKKLIAALLKRGLQALIVALIVGLVSFAMMQALPGDAAFRIAAGRYGYDLMDAAAAEAVRQELGLDRHWSLQLFDWLKALAQFNLGESLIYRGSVSEKIAVQLGHTLTLSLSALFVSILIAFPIGIYTGLNPNGWVDKFFLHLSIFLRAIPPFAIGLTLVLIFSVHLKLFPVAGFRSFNHLILPSLTLGIGMASVSNRVIRDSVLEAMHSDWQLFSRIKGLPHGLTLRAHVLRNAALPSVTYIGVQMAYLIEGVVIIETLFAWPGIGHALIHAIFGRDIAMVQGTALTLGLIYVGLNLAIDLLCSIIDPRSPKP